MKLCTAALAFLTAATLSTTASAELFKIDYENPGVWQDYDSENEFYSFMYRSDQGKDGFWLVVTDGSNPNGQSDKYAILYGDLKNNRITAYNYDGENSSTSFRDNELLGVYENVFTPGGTHAGSGYELTNFRLDVSELNSSLGDDFQGVSIGETAGIWFHQSSGTNFEYGADGSIVDYTFDNQMFLDRGSDATRVFDSLNCGENNEFCQSTQISLANGSNPGTSSGGGSVPAPGGLALLLTGLAGIGFSRRRKKD